MGGNAQIRAMRKVAGRLKLELAQYRDLEAFAQFGSELDAATQRTLARGARFVATLNQPAYAPWPVEEQVVVIYAANQGLLDRVEVSDVPDVNERSSATVREKAPEVLDEVRDTKDLSDEAVAKLDEILPGVVDQFAAPEEEVLDQPPADELEEAEEAEEARRRAEETADAAASR